VIPTDTPRTSFPSADTSLMPSAASFAWSCAARTSTCDCAVMTVIESDVSDVSVA
jgi:hypothetical protein